MVEVISVGKRILLLLNALPEHFKILASGKAPMRKVPIMIKEEKNLCLLKETKRDAASELLISSKNIWKGTGKTTK